MMRRRFGVGLGSVLQLMFVLIGVWLPAMFVIGAIFVAIWLRLLLVRRDIVGTPGGARMLVS
jgi:hypothetical protein